MIAGLAHRCVSGSRPLRNLETPRDDCFRSSASSCGIYVAIIIVDAAVPTRSTTRGSALLLLITRLQELTRIEQMPISDLPSNLICNRGSPGTLLHILYMGHEKHATRHPSGGPRKGTRRSVGQPHPYGRTSYHLLFACRWASSDDSDMNPGGVVMRSTKVRLRFGRTSMMNADSAAMLCCCSSLSINRQVYRRH